MIERSTYSFLDWLGDVGGLFDGLYYVAQAIVWPITAFVLKADMLESVFR